MGFLYRHSCFTCHPSWSMHNVGLINHTLQRTHAGTQDVSKTNSWSNNWKRGEKRQWPVQGQAWLCRWSVGGANGPFVSCFVSSLLISFSSHAIYFWTIKRTVFKVWSIKIIRDDFCVAEISGARLGRFPSIKSSKLLNFKAVRAKWIRFSKWVDIKNKLKLAKNGGCHDGVSSLNRPFKNQTF